MSYLLSFVFKIILPMFFYEFFLCYEENRYLNIKWCIPSTHFLVIETS